MALVGHAAAGMNVFLDIPFFLRGLSQSMHHEAGPEFSISKKLRQEIERVDPRDPTGIADEYYCDWWNFAKEWETHPVVVDQDKAFRWHLEKVMKKIYIWS